MLALEMGDDAVDAHVASCNLDIFRSPVLRRKLIILAAVEVFKLPVNPSAQHLRCCCVSLRDVHYSCVFPLYVLDTCKHPMYGTLVYN